MNITNKQIREYVESRKHAWAPTTCASSLARLNAVREAINGDPEYLWDYIEDYLKPYSRITTWTVVTGFWSWYEPNKTNVYKNWKETNARRFKHAYQREPARYSYNEVKARLSSIKHDHIRNRALKMLSGGLRWCESGQGNSDSVRGKGSKVRAVWAIEICDSGYEVSYQQFRRALASVGLKSHDLRKAFATELVRKGANEFELCKIMGWSNIQTALSYINVEDNRIEDLVRKVQNEAS